MKKICISLLLLCSVAISVPVFGMEKRKPKRVTERGRIKRAERQQYLTKKLLDACEENKPLEDIAKYVTKGAGVNARGTLNKTPLYSTVAHNNSVTAKHLITHGADINAKNDHPGLTVLHKAVLNTDSPDMAVLLLEHGSDPNAQNNLSQTPLFFAHGHEIHQRLLIRWGAEPYNEKTIKIKEDLEKECTEAQ